MYRILRPLRGESDDHILSRGSLHDLAYLPKDVIERLMKQGVVARVASPPLTQLRGWSHRAKRLEPEGIITVEQFLEAQEAALARIMSRSEDQIIAWKQELRDLLIAPPKRDC